jgi:hypothetical protein
VRPLTIHSAKLVLYTGRTQVVHRSYTGCTHLGNAKTSVNTGQTHLTHLELRRQRGGEFHCRRRRKESLIFPPAAKISTATGKMRIPDPKLVRGLCSRCSECTAGGWRLARCKCNATVSEPIRTNPNPERPQITLRSEPIRTYPNPIEPNRTYPPLPPDFRGHPNLARAHRASPVGFFCQMPSFGFGSAALSSYEAAPRRVRFSAFAQLLRTVTEGYGRLRKATDSSFFRPPVRTRSTASRP